METDPPEPEIEALLREWERTILAGDAAAAAGLRTDDYAMTLPDGTVLAGAEEIAWTLSRESPPPVVRIKAIEVAKEGDAATVTTDISASRDYEGEALFRWTIMLSRRDGGWRAARSVVALRGEQPAPAPKAPGNPLARVVHRLAGRLRRLALGRPATFQDLAYLPYRPGADYSLPLPEPRAPDAAPAALPVPPRSLWLGYKYPAHGGEHVRRMLDLAAASGYAPGPGDRILDFGCGAGRLIRHLAHLAGSCEIWGTDISAEHINWCRQHLRPPFHFATTTKVPHLPFEDRSFNLVYCGSVFTHIDDLADAWLLELHRILADRGRLYVTIHDEHTIRLFGKTPYRDADYVRKIGAHATFRAAKPGFGMFTVDRDNDSQVFYESAFFARMLSPMFDIVSVTPEAYFYQTAYLLRRRGG